VPQTASKAIFSSDLGTRFKHILQYQKGRFFCIKIDNQAANLTQSTNLNGYKL